MIVSNLYIFIFKTKVNETHAFEYENVLILESNVYASLMNFITEHSPATCYQQSNECGKVATKIVWNVNSVFDGLRCGCTVAARTSYYCRDI